MVCSIKQWTSSKFVQIMALAPQMALPKVTQVLHIDLYSENMETIFLFETTNHRALIFVCNIT